MCCKLNNYPQPPLPLHCFSRPLPSLESPQLDFVTPTEEVAVPLRQEKILLLEQAVEESPEIPLPQAVKTRVDIPESLKQTEVPEPTQQTVEHLEQIQSTKAALSKEQNEVQLSEPIKRVEQSPEELPDTKWELVVSSEVETELREPLKSTARLQEQLENEKPEPTKTLTELLEPEKNLSDLLEEKSLEVPPEEPLNVPAEETAVEETVQDPAEELLSSG